MKKHLLIIAGLMAVAAGSSIANPEGGQVTGGSATISTTPGTVTVNQSSHAVVINWQSFSIGAGELTKFVQPSASSAALNRVLGGQTSQINGTLSGNGQIYLTNGNGIVIGPGGVVNAAGFTASTRDISDSDFLNGNYHFTGNGAAGVQNLGTINALGGSVYLIGHTVDNRGAISAPGGTVGLAAGDDILITQGGSEHVFVSPAGGSASGAGMMGVHNSGTISAAAAELKAANGNIYALAINNEGTIRAKTVQNQGGRIFLVSDTGTVRNSGVLNASATANKGKGGDVTLKVMGGYAAETGQILAKGGIGGEGGSADVSGMTVTFGGTVDMTALHGKTGSLLLDPVVLTVATLDVTTGGTGTIVGGQNAPPDTTIDPSSVQSALASSNVTLNADNTIIVTSGITWTSNNSLTLSTNIGGSTITINAPITATNGTLVINAAGAADMVTTGVNGSIKVGAFQIQSGTWHQVGSTLPSFQATDFQIGGNGSFIRAAGGGGTIANPYIITDVYGLQGMGSQPLLNQSFALGKDIDATGTSSWNGGMGFMPIGNSTTEFTGTLDGAYHIIKNLYINQPSGSDLGLFSFLGTGSMVSDLGLLNAQVSGQGDLGTLVGFFDAGDVHNVYASEGSVIGAQGNVGGLVGVSVGGFVATSYSSANVSGNGNVGGLMGYNQNYVTDSYSLGNVQGGGGSNEEGGLVGYNSGLIARTYSTGAVTTSGGTGDYGGLVGYNAGTINDSFWDTATTGQANGVGYNAVTVNNVQGLATAALLQQSTYTGSGWDIGTDPFAHVWVSFDGNTRPMLGMEYTTTITNAHQLQLIGLNGTTLAGHYTMAADINTPVTTYASEVWGTSLGTGLGFMPIGGNISFTGTFDGMNHSINNLYINRPTETYSSLFGAANGATLQNVTVNNVETHGGFYGGALVGYATNHTLIINCASNGSIEVDSGIAAGWAGGLVGYIENGAMVVDSHSSASVTSNFSAGGLVGENYIGGLVQYSTSTGTVNGTKFAGGLVGGNYGIIDNSYSTASATANNVDGFAGGLSATIEAGMISNSYSTGTPSGFYVGGLVGGDFAGHSDTFPSTGIAVNSFWDQQTSGITTSNGAGTPENTAFFSNSANFPSSWDFSNIWLSSGPYPSLRPNLAPNPPTPPTPPNPTPDNKDKVLAQFDAYTAHGAPPLILVAYNPNATNPNTTNVENPNSDGGAINNGEGDGQGGNNIASGSSTGGSAGSGGKGGLVTEGNGIHAIFGGTVNTIPPPPPVVQRFLEILNAGSHDSLHDAAFGTH